MLKDILSISGKGGLFKFISQGRNGIIVESLSDHKRSSVNAAAKISSLEDISVFTEDEEISLEKVFKLISEREDGGPAISHKASNEELKSYFSEVLPEYDRSRVYVSDIKKIIQWYNTLQEMEMLRFEEADADDQNSSDEPTSAAQASSDKPASDKQDASDAQASSDKQKS